MMPGYDKGDGVPTIMSMEAAEDMDQRDYITVEEEEVVPSPSTASGAIANAPAASGPAANALYPAA
jgi:hypothetical protein